VLLLGKPEGKRLVGRVRYGWVDNIKMDLGEIESSGVNYIGLAQDKGNWRALVNAVIMALVVGALSSAPMNRVN
jgi:hypothetical protein